ncbi:hypothetical protein ACLB2K_072075 [Fragaria x ananassa]
MKGGGSLEVLLVDAEDIRHTNVLGKPAYYVILECGTQVCRTKISSEEDDKVTWNEKFTFEFSDWKHLTHLKFRIMDTEMFTDGGFVGETMIHIGRIITEGKDRGFIEVKPSPYNVVLEDDTYKGEIKIGFKFVANVKFRRRWELFGGLDQIQWVGPSRISLVAALEFAKRLVLGGCTNGKDAAEEEVQPGECIKFYYAQKMKKSSRVSVEWIPRLGIPEQKDGKACAYLVMCYMMDIIVDKDLEFAAT